jgi:hypothetical protein
MPHTKGPWEIESLHTDGRCEISVGGLAGAEDVYVASCYRDDAPVIAAAPEMYALLKEIEWTGHNVHLSLVDLCPVCENHVQCGHSPDCKLAAVLKAVEGE